MTPENHVGIYFFGEGKTDLGEGPDLSPPESGVLPIVVHTLCGTPSQMRVIRRRYAHLQGKGLWQKVRFAKQQAHGRSAGAVFVMDTDGDLKALAKMISQMETGRDSTAPSFPMAIGAAQPCVEAWLLADSSAVRDGLNLPKRPHVPEHSEELPPPCKDEKGNPKAVLATLAGSGHKDLAADQKWAIAKRMGDMGLVRQRCPRGFAPFADEVKHHIGPLF